MSTTRVVRGVVATLAAIAGIAGGVGAARAQTPCPAGSQTINCQFDAIHGWIVNGTAPKDEAPRLPRDVAPMDPREIERLRQRFLQKQKLDRARGAWTLWGENLPYRGQGTCPEVKSLGLDSDGKRPDELAAASAAAMKACDERDPSQATAGAACKSAYRLLRLPKKKNPAQDLRAAYYYGVKTCLVGGPDESFTCSMMAGSNPKTDCVAERDPPAPTGTRGTCSLQTYTFGPLSEDVQRDVLTSFSATCRRFVTSPADLDRQAAACFSVAVGHATFSTPAADPHLAYQAVRDACRAELASAQRTQPDVYELPACEELMRCDPP